MRLFYVPLLLAVCGCLPARAADPTSTAYVVDGDTLVLDGREYDLAHIDAPERDQVCGFKKWRYACGRMATFALIEILGEHWVRCEPQRNAPSAATCYIGPTELAKDVAAMMVRRGWALAHKPDRSRYAAEEKAARAAKAGLWKGVFDKPWEWRKR